MPLPCHLRIPKCNSLRVKATHFQHMCISWGVSSALPMSTCCLHAPQQTKHDAHVHAMGSMQ